MNKESPNNLQEAAFQAYFKQYGTDPKWIVRAPGRVNLIGEHTDYNDGFVLPMAIDRAVWIAGGDYGEEAVHAYSVNFEGSIHFPLNEITHSGPEWGEYLKGIAWILQREGYLLKGWKGIIVGNVPRGAGLSSSAAVELAAVRAFCQASIINWEPKAMALLAQKAENEWVGVKCGIMDQMISAAGESGTALLIDCRSLELQHVPLPADTQVVIMDTGTRRGLVDSAYNERREQCERAAEFFGVPALRDVSVENFVQEAEHLDPLTRRRARHVIYENSRTRRAAELLADNDPQRVGKLMVASHISLRDDFEVSSGELDLMVQLALQEESCYGARMTGAGFGGCAVALVDRSQTHNFAKRVSQAYQDSSGIKPKLYLCDAVQGANLVYKS